MACLAVAPPTLGEAAPHGSDGIGDPYFPLDGNGGIDVLSYDIHDRYRFAQRRLSGWTALRLRATETLSGFDLDFLLPVSEVAVDGRRVHFDQSRHHELAIDTRLDRGKSVRVVVRYSGFPQRYAYDGESNWLASATEVVAMNQPHMAPWWFPANDHPLDKARVKMSITVPKGKRVIGNGRLVGREVHGGLATTTWRADEPMVPYLAFFAAGRYAVDRGRADGRPWLVAVSKALPTSSQQEAMRLMKRTPHLLHWLESVVGDYPFSVTGGLTTSLDPGFALENQTRPTYPFMGEGPAAVRTVVHELAHQWFGDSVAVERWKDIWLNEGAATFFEEYYSETHDGRTAQQWMRGLYDGIGADDSFWDHRVADPCPQHQSCVNSIFASYVYYRGGMALQALRNVIGDEPLLHAAAPVGRRPGRGQRRDGAVRGAGGGGQRPGPERVLRRLAAHAREAGRHGRQRPRLTRLDQRAAAPTGRSRSPRASRTRRCRPRPPAGPGPPGERASPGRSWPSAPSPRPAPPRAPRAPRARRGTTATPPGRRPAVRTRSRCRRGARSPPTSGAAPGTPVRRRCGRPAVPAVRRAARGRRRWCGRRGRPTRCRRA